MSTQLTRRGREGKEINEHSHIQETLTVKVFFEMK